MCVAAENKTQYKSLPSAAAAAGRNKWTTTDDECRASSAAADISWNSYRWGRGNKKRERERNENLGNVAALFVVLWIK